MATYRSSFDDELLARAIIDMRLLEILKFIDNYMEYVNDSPNYAGTIRNIASEPVISWMYIIGETYQFRYIGPLGQMPEEFTINPLLDHEIKNRIDIAL
jgi:hypothetical protein